MKRSSILDQIFFARHRDNSTEGGKGGSYIKKDGVFVDNFENNPYQATGCYFVVVHRNLFSSLRGTSSKLNTLSSVIFFRLSTLHVKGTEKA